MLTWVNNDVSQLENSSQNTKNVVLLFVRKSEKSESVLSRQELGSVVDAGDDRVITLRQINELKKKKEIMMTNILK